MDLNQQREITLIDALDEAVILLNDKGRISHANPMACQMLGISIDKLLNQQISNHLATYQEDNDTQAICFKPIDHGTLKSSFTCGHHIKTIKLPSAKGEPCTAIIWSPDTASMNTFDRSTGLPDRNMLNQQLNALLNQNTLSMPHSLVKLQIVSTNNQRLEGIDPHLFESLMTDLAALLSPNIRQRDLLARADVDNFVLLLRGCDLAHAEKITQKLLAEIMDYHEDYPDTNLPGWRVCTGIVALTNGQPPNEIFAQVKNACQKACTSKEGIAVIATGSWENQD